MNNVPFEMGVIGVTVLLAQVVLAFTGISLLRVLDPPAWPYMVVVVIMAGFIDLVAAGSFWMWSCRASGPWTADAVTSWLGGLSIGLFFMLGFVARGVIVFRRRYLSRPPAAPPVVS